MLTQIQRRFGDLLADSLLAGSQPMPGIAAWRCIGANTNVFSTTGIWIDLSPLGTSANPNLASPFDDGISALEIVSSSAADTAAGAGLRTVTVEGVNTLGTAFSESVTMNGVTAVALFNPYIAVNYAYARTAGNRSNGASGNITIRRLGGAGNNYSQILAGQTFAAQALYGVPTSRQLRITAIGIGTTVNVDDCPIEVEVVATSWLGSTATLGTPAPYITQGRWSAGGSGSIYHVLDTPIMVPALNGVKVRARSVSGAAGSIPGVTVTLEGYLFTIPS